MSGAQIYLTVCVVALIAVTAIRIVRTRRAVREHPQARAAGRRCILWALCEVALYIGAVLSVGRLAFVGFFVAVVLVMLVPSRRARHALGEAIRGEQAVDAAAARP